VLVLLVAVLCVAGVLGPVSAQAATSGHVYIADTFNNRVVDVAPDGSQTTVGSGLDHPEGVAVDGAGNVFIADTGNGRVVEVHAFDDSFTFKSTGQAAQPGAVLGPGAPGTYEDIPFTIHDSERNSAVAISLSWNNPADDWDLYVYRRNAEGGLDQVGSSAGRPPSTNEQTVIQAEEGQYVVRAQNYAATSPDFTGFVKFVTADTTAPTVTLDTPVNGSKTDDDSPTFSGTGGTGAGDGSAVTVKIWTGSTVGSGAPDYTRSATRDPSTGAYSSSGPYTKVSDSSTVTTLPDGTYTAQAFQTDTAGNTGQSTATPTFTIDTVAPSAPSGLSTIPGSPGQSSAPKVKGTAETGSTVNVYATSSCSGKPVASGTASSFVSPGLAAAPVAEGSTVTYYATATDRAGNTSRCSIAHATYTRRASPPVCSVPALKGKTLAQAKTLLSRAHCALGKVTQPRTRRGRKFVISQSPAARSVRPVGTKVAVRLAPLGRGSLHVTLGAPRPSITVLRLHSGCLRPNFLGRFIRFRITGHDRGHVKGFRFRVDHRPTRLRQRRSFRLTLDIPHLRRGRHILRIVATGHSGRHRLRKVAFRRC
jgi:hypothetical protein